MREPIPPEAADWPAHLSELIIASYGLTAASWINDVTSRG